MTNNNYPEFSNDFDYINHPIDDDIERKMPLLDRLERMFAVLAIMYQSGSVYAVFSWNFSSADPMMTRNDVMETTSIGGGIARYFVFICFYCLLFIRWRSVWAVLKQRKALWLFMGWLILSCQWSINPLSQRLASEIVGITLMGLYFASRFTLREFMKLAFIGFGITIVMNFLFCLAFPQFGIQVGLQQGSWRGMAVQKNSLARIVVFGSIPLLCFVYSNVRENAKLYWWGLVLSSVLILLSNSKTGLLIFLIVNALIPVFQKMRSRNYLALPLFICIVLAGIMASLLLLGNYEDILIGLGRDPSLSGRTEIWEAMIEKIMERPFTGYGYNGFWLAREGESLDIWYRAKDLPPHGHNGYLNLSLDLGLVGLGLFLASYFKAIARSFRWLRETPGPEGLMPIICMVELFLYNITEESLVSDANFNVYWMFYVYITTAILIQPLGTTLLEPTTPIALEERTYDIDHNSESIVDSPPTPILDSEA